MTRYDPSLSPTHHELRDEIIARSLHLLKRSGIERTEEVDDPGNYTWHREYEVEDLWILEEVYDLTVYVRMSGATDIVCSFRDPEADFLVVSHWNYDLVIQALEVLRRDMVLEDLSDL